MVLPPGRVGGLRGEGAPTIASLLALGSEILAAIEDLNATINLNTNQVAELVAAIGTPADTDCGDTALTLLCTIAGELVGTDGTSVGAPIANCPGFPANPTAWTYANSWLMLETSSGPTGDAAPQWTSAGNMATVLWEEFIYNELDPTYVLTRFITAEDATNLCFSWDKRNGGYAFVVRKYNLATDALITSTPLDLTNDPNVGSHSISLDTDEYLVVFASTAGGPVPELPDATLWVTQGPFG